LVVAQFLAKSSIGVYIRGERGVAAAAVRERLEPQTAALQAKLNKEVGTEKCKYLFISRENIDISDRSTWDTAADWLSNHRKRYEAALGDILGARA
jgi:hypothetical protein